MTRVDTGQPVGMAERAERLGPPGAGNGLAPGNAGLSSSFVPANAGAGQEAHSLAERQAIIGRATLDRLKLVERAAQSLAIDLDPPAANQDEPIGVRQQPLDLGPRQAFAVERPLHPEVKQRIEPEL